MLECYDFIIYIFLAPILEKVFFADQSGYIATLKTLAIFSIGYLLRPLGGIIFSHLGDRHGRKVTFLLTVLFMAVPSFAIGLLPTANAIGNFAPFMLLIFRMMQGLAFGGEIPAAITFVFEHSLPNKRGLSLGILFVGTNLGLLLGSFTTSTLSTLLSPDQLITYGWRIPFLLGGMFGILSIFLRRQLQETAAFASLAQKDIARIPFIVLLQRSRKEIFAGMFLVALGAIAIFLYLYWPQYLHQYLHYDFTTLMYINTICLFLMNIAIIAGGLLADKIGYRRAHLINSAALALLTYPLFFLFQLQSFTWVIVSYLIFSILFGMFPAGYLGVLTQLFPTHIRYSGYNLAYAIVGGLSPIVSTISIHVFQSVMAPAVYIMMIAACSFVACYLMKPQKHASWIEQNETHEQYAHT